MPIMFDAAVKALTQMFTPELRRILWRAIGLALILIAVVAIVLQRLLSWFATSGTASSRRRPWTSWTAWPD